MCSHFVEGMVISAKYADSPPENMQLQGPKLNTDSFVFHRHGLTSMARAQAAALRSGVERFRKNDNTVKVFEMTLRNEVRVRVVAFAGCRGRFFRPMDSSLLKCFLDRTVDENIHYSIRERSKTPPTPIHGVNTNSKPGSQNFGEFDIVLRTARGILRYRIFYFFVAKAWRRPANSPVDLQKECTPVPPLLS